MTRINANIPPAILTDWHLIAETNELPHILDVYNYRIENDMHFNDIPKQFTLGKGHIIFFLDKFKYLCTRYNELVSEVNIRRLRDQVNIVAFGFIGLRQYNDYQFSEEETGKVIARICQRITESDKLPQYYGEKISKDQAIKMLTDFCKPTEDPQLKLQL